ncbi:serine carboxypeptidase s28 domain-containing protein [Phthorimaea operculella]|nr:serine carboxypeptidase s28 domain-containing protein [Phthorimaea operculella]
MYTVIYCVSFLLLKVVSLDAFAPCPPGVGLAVDKKNTKHNGEPKDYEVKFIVQRLDHFDDKENRTFTNLYLQDISNFQQNGPIYLYLSRTLPAQNELPSLMANKLAIETHGAVIVPEIRYYGSSSRPLNISDTKNLKYMTSQQVLADLVHLIKTIKSQPTFKSSKVVVMGGDYAGGLAAEMRYKYPDVVDCAWASSAAYLAKTNFYEFLEHDPWRVLGITKSLNDDAPAVMIDGSYHAADLYEPDPEDSKSLTKARDYAEKMVKYWVGLGPRPAPYNATILKGRALIPPAAPGTVRAAPLSTGIDTTTSKTIPHSVVANLLHKNVLPKAYSSPLLDTTTSKTIPHSVVANLLHKNVLPKGGPDKKVPHSVLGGRALIPPAAPGTVRAAPLSTGIDTTTSKTIPHSVVANLLHKNVLPKGGPDKKEPHSVLGGRALIPPAAPGTVRAAPLSTGIDTTTSKTIPHSVVANLLHKNVLPKGHKIENLQKAHSTLFRIVAIVTCYIVRVATVKNLESMRISKQQNLFKNLGGRALIPPAAPGTVRAAPLSTGIDTTTSKTIPHSVVANLLHKNLGGRALIPPAAPGTVRAAPLSTGIDTTTSKTIPHSVVANLLHKNLGGRALIPPAAPGTVRAAPLSTGIDTTTSKTIPHSVVANLLHKNLGGRALIPPAAPGTVRAAPLSTGIDTTTSKTIPHSVVANLLHKNLGGRALIPPAAPGTVRAAPLSTGIDTTTSKTIPHSVVANLLHKNVLPKGGQKIAISSAMNVGGVSVGGVNVGNVNVGGSVQAIAFTTAQLKARQARLIQPRHHPLKQKLVKYYM